MKTKRKSGAGGMADRGRLPVQIWLTPEQHEQLFAAARADGRKATQFMVHHGLAAAKKILEKYSK